MNLSSFRSGDRTCLNAECIKGYSFKSAVAGVESAHFQTAMAANGSSIASAGAAI